jgi:hypothetical protein
MYVAAHCEIDLNQLADRKFDRQRTSISPTAQSDVSSKRAAVKYHSNVSNVHSNSFSNSISLTERKDESLNIELSH